MNFFSYLRVELNRIFHAKTARIIMLLTMICPMIGYNLSKNTIYNINPNMFGDTISCKLIANPCLIGTLVGGVLFALLTLLEFDKVRKYETMALTNSIISPLISNVVRVIGIIVAAIVSVLITALLYLPYTVIKMGSLFNSYTYLNCFFLFMLPSIILSIIAASAFYQIFCRVDVSMVAFILFAVVSCNKRFHGSNILHWLFPSIPTLSDYFSNSLVFRLMNYNRLFWFLVLTGLWLMTLLCVRSYGKGLLGSVLHNLKKAYIPIIAIVLMGGGCYLYMNQPLIYDVNSASSDLPRSSQIKLSSTDLDIKFDTNKHSLLGKANYTLQNLSGESQQCILRLNPGYSIYHIIANGNSISFKGLKNEDNSIVFMLPSDQEIKLNIEYSGSPKILKSSSDVLLMTTISDNYIDLPGNDLYPTLVLDKENKNPQISGKFTMPSNLIPVSEGGTVKLLSENGSNKTWNINSNGNSFYSFYLMAGDYTMKNLGDKDIPVEFYYGNKAKPNMSKMSAEEIMNYTIKYCKNHYGKLYSVSENNPLKIVQGSAFHLGGLGLADLSLMAESSFSDNTLNKKSTGSSASDLLAHETVHQWWNFRYIKDDKNDDWTAEGLTVFTCYRIMKEKYGEEYAQKNYVDFWKKGIKENNNDFYNRYPEYLKLLPEDYVRDITGIDRVTREYMKIPLQVLKATELVGGDANMDKILAKLYGDIPKKKTICWQDFLDACGLREEDLKVD